MVLDTVPISPDLVEVRRKLSFETPTPPIEVRPIATSCTAEARPPPTASTRNPRTRPVSSVVFTQPPPLAQQQRPPRCPPSRTSPTERNVEVSPPHISPPPSPTATADQLPTIEVVTKCSTTPLPNLSPEEALWQSGTPQTSLTPNSIARRKRQIQSCVAGERATALLLRRWGHLDECRLEARRRTFGSSNDEPEHGWTPPLPPPPRGAREELLKCQQDLEDALHEEMNQKKPQKPQVPLPGLASYQRRINVLQTEEAALRWQYIQEEGGLREACGHQFCDGWREVELLEMRREKLKHEENIHRLQGELSTLSEKQLAFSRQQECAAAALCWEYVVSTALSTHFKNDGDVCYCLNCWCAGKVTTILQQSGVPAASYSLPVGWSRFALARDTESSETGHLAFCGLKLSDLQHLLATTVECQSKWFAGRIVSPSIRHCEWHDIRDGAVQYWSMHPEPFSGHQWLVCAELRVPAGSYIRRPQTLGAVRAIDTHIPNSEVEWLLALHGRPTLTAVYIRRLS